MAQVTIRNATVHDAKFNKGLYIKYRPFKETEFTSTKSVAGTLSPEFNHSKVFHFDSVKQDHLDWFDTGCIAFQLFGHQEDSDPDATRSRMTTKVRICLTAHQAVLDRMLRLTKSRAVKRFEKMFYMKETCRCFC